VSPGPVEVNPNETLGDATVPEGPEVIDVTGAVVSRV
jgi:hypothetical protein